MTFTERALAAKAITQNEADEMENWIDENVQEGETANVPKHLHNILDRCLMFMFNDGVMQ